MIRLKICGMQTREDVERCAAAGADALGFIFADGPRKLSPAAAAPLTAAVPRGVAKVGVFANTPRDVIEAALLACELDVLQFAGDEDPDACGSFGLPTLLVTRQRAPALDIVSRARAIGVIIDAHAPGLYGGSGIRADVTAVQRVRASSPAPVILAGGLTPGNVGDAIRALRPDGVDVRSGVERGGNKDPGLVAQFARAVKEAYDARS